MIRNDRGLGRTTTDRIQFHKEIREENIRQAFEGRTVSANDIQRRNFRLLPTRLTILTIHTTLTDATILIKIVSKKRNLVLD